MKVSMPSTAAAGRAIGRMTCQNSPQVLQPSIRPASSSSVGTAPDRYWVMKKTPNALTMNGAITAYRVSVQSIFAIRMYSGMMPSWVGTIRVMITPRYSADEPRNRSLAKAKPASVEKSTTLNVIEPTTRPPS